MDISVFIIRLHDMTTSKQSAPEDLMYIQWRCLIKPDVLAVCLILLLPSACQELLALSHPTIPTTALPKHPKLKLPCQLQASCTRAICSFVSNANPTKSSILSQRQKNQRNVGAEEGLNSCTRDQPAPRNGLKQKPECVCSE